MQTAPTYYNEIYEEGNYDVEYKVNIDWTDYDQSNIWSLKTSRALLTADTPLVGNALVGQIDLTITKPQVQFARMAAIKPYLRLHSRTRTRNAISGWLQKGEFFIDTRSTDETDGIKTLQMQGFDAMRKANVTYPSSTLTWDATHPSSLQVVQEIARHLGVSLDSRTTAVLQATPHVIAFPAQFTIAETLGSIAAMYGGNFCMSDSGKLLLVELLDLPEETFLLINENGKYITFGGVRIKLRAGG